MKESTLPVTVNIFGKEYKIACSKGEREDLLNSAQQLDQQMLEIRDTGKVVGTDRIAVLAALNFAHELKSAQKESDYVDRGLSTHLVALRHKIESVLNKS